MSFASGDEVPQISTRKPRLRPLEFLAPSAKRLFQHYPSKAAARTLQKNSKSCRKRRKLGSSESCRLITWRSPHDSIMTYGLGNRFQLSNVNSLRSSCCRCVASTGRGILWSPIHPRPGTSAMRQKRAFASHLLGHGATYDGDILACIQILFLLHRSGRLIVFGGR
jgi:hypothetical protein